MIFGWQKPFSVLREFRVARTGLLVRVAQSIASVCSSLPTGRLSQWTMGFVAVGELQRIIQKLLVLFFLPAVVLSAAVDRLGLTRNLNRPKQPQGEIAFPATGGTNDLVSTLVNR